jgi:hypothetical protein
MEWLQTTAIVIFNFGMMTFMIREMRQISRDIANESRDFHGRLCRLEERYIEINQKVKK